MSVTSDEVNFLVYRYLQESGFQHSAFTFANESNVIKSNINGASLPLGTMVSYLQKGLLYTEMESHISNDGCEMSCNAGFSLVKVHTCDKATKKRKLNGDLDRSTLEVGNSDIITLKGHSAEVFICSWSKAGDRLASGSGDSTARIWHVAPGKSAATIQRSSAVLAHNVGSDSRDVTTLDWSKDDKLVTGAYDGSIRVWNVKGELTKSLNLHKGPIFSLKWNKTGKCLLSGSVDLKTVIWDVEKGKPQQVFEFHDGPTLDVDWRDETTFASCSTDQVIYVCKQGNENPVRCFQGHAGEVNSITWDPSGTYLASCSDDFTAKVWSMEQDTPVHDFRDHTKEIYALKWSPTGPGSANPDKPLLLASASFDHTVRVYDIKQGKLVYNLDRHTEPVYSVSFSPNGDYLASGSFDRCLYIWSMKTGELLKTFTAADGGIFEVSWNSKGDKVAACYSNNNIEVVTIDLP